MRFEVHSHTEYSNERLIDCINKPKDLIDRAIKIGLNGIAITDHESLSSHIKVNKYAQEILDKTAQWTEKIYDWSYEEVQSYLDNRGTDCNRILYIEYQYYQIGLTQKWLRDISAKIGDPLVVRREILLQRLHGSSLSPFPQEDIEYIFPFFLFKNQFYY